MTNTRGAHTHLRRLATLVATTGLVLSGAAVGQAHAAPAAAPERAVPAKAAASSAKWAYATSTVNVRSGPSTRTKAIGRLVKGGHVGVITTNTTRGWVKVNYKGRTAYISSSYVRISAPGKKATTKSSTVKTSSAVGTCKASYYGEGSRTASGERFNPSAMTAAHKTYKFGTKLKVTNKANGRSVVVRINDRGPYVSGRCLDLSTGAFKKIASTSAGVATVTYQVVR